MISTNCEQTIAILVYKKLALTFLKVRLPPNYSLTNIINITI